MIVKINAYIPCRSEDEELDLQVQLLINEFNRVSGKISIPLDEFGEACLKISTISESEFNELNPKSKSNKIPPLLSVLKFSSEIEFEEVYQYDLSKLETHSNNVDLNRAHLIGIFHSRFESFLSFSQLAVPGTLFTHKGVYVIDNEIHPIPIYPLTSVMTGWSVFEKKQGWPPIANMAIDDVWLYISNKTNILNSSSKSNIENGLCAFTYLIGETEDAANTLFWAMSGIESLYVEGENGIAYQIDTKSRVFLGAPTENKKILKKLYNYRSRFLHGGLSIPIKNGWIQEGVNTDQHYVEINDMAFLASKLLIATLQKIISEDLNIFTFEYHLA